MMKNILSVLILNRNNADDVLNLYEELKQQTYQDFHVIVIDDNSELSDLNKLLGVKEDRLNVHSYPAPWKFGNDNKWNLGLQKANASGSRYTYTIQTDMVINNDNLLEKLVEHMETHERCGAACPTIFNGQNEMTWGPGIEKIRMGKIYNINETFITRNSAIKQMNYVNHKLIFYGHEFYFNNWMKLKGFETDALPEVSVTHYGGGTSGKYWNYKYYYRARTTILIMRLFNKDDSTLQKCRYFRSECWEIESRLHLYKKSQDWREFVQLTGILIGAVIVGLIIPISLNDNRI